MADREFKIGPAKSSINSRGHELVYRSPNNPGVKNVIGLNHNEILSLYITLGYCILRLVDKDRKSHDSKLIKDSLEELQNWPMDWYSQPGKEYLIKYSDGVICHIDGTFTNQHKAMEFYVKLNGEDELNQGAIILPKKDYYKTKNPDHHESSSNHQ